MRGAVLVLALAFAAPIAGAQQVYRWIDKDGRTHYGERPPADARDVKKMDAPPPGAATAPRTEDWRERDAQSRSRRANSEADSQERAQRQAERANACANANQRLRVLRMQLPLYSKDDAGNRTYLDDDQRAREIALEEQRAKENCGP